MGADFKEWDLEESLYLPIMLPHPFPGHEEGGGDFPLNQIVDQSLIVACAFTHGAEVERQRDSGTCGWTRLDHLGLREGRHRWDEQHCEDKAQHVWHAAESHGDEYTRSRRLRKNDHSIPASRWPMHFGQRSDNPQADKKIRPARPQRVKTGGVALLTRPPQAAKTACSPSGVR